MHVCVCVCVCTSAQLLWRRMATCLCGSRLASAGSVVVQTLQNALSQKPDVSVRLWVCVNKLQLLQATLLQQHAAIASGCRTKGTIQYCIGKPRVKVPVMFRCVCFCSDRSCCRRAAWPKLPTAGRRGCGNTPVEERRD